MYKQAPIALSLHDGIPHGGLGLAAKNCRTSGALGFGTLFIVYRYTNTQSLAAIEDRCKDCRTIQREFQLKNNAIVLELVCVSDWPHRIAGL